MAANWAKEKAWSDKFIPSVQAALGSHYFSVASLADDQLRNTDLIVLNMNGERIGVRIRRHDYLRKYPFQFTIRAALPSGNRTELQKILQDNWGDIFFYGFANATETGLAHWLIGDLDVFRRAYHNLPKTRRENDDRSSDFEAFEWQFLPPEFFVALSPLADLMPAICHFCGAQVIIYGGNEHKRICRGCERLFDFTYVIERHQTMRKSIKQEAL